MLYYFLVTPLFHLVLLIQLVLLAVLGHKFLFLLLGRGRKSWAWLWWLLSRSTCAYHDSGWWTWSLDWKLRRSGRRCWKGHLCQRFNDVLSAWSTLDTWSCVLLPQLLQSQCLESKIRHIILLAFIFHVPLVSQGPIIIKKTLHSWDFVNGLLIIDYYWLKITLHIGGSRPWLHLLSAIVNFLISFQGFIMFFHLLQ